MLIGGRHNFWQAGFAAGEVGAGPVAIEIDGKVRGDQIILSAFVRADRCARADEIAGTLLAERAGKNQLCSVVDAPVAVLPGGDKSGRTSASFRL